MKEIHIKNWDEIKNKLFLYKTVLYKNSKFLADTDDEEIVSIVEALNIKKRKERIKFIFDYSCNKINNFNNGENICGFKNNQCINQQVPECKNVNGCCRQCIHQSSNGCKTSNLSCKMFYCPSVTNKYKVLKYKDLKILKLLSFRQKLIVRNNFFATREEFITDLCIESLIIHSIRLLYRSIKNSKRLNILRKEKLI